MSEAPTPVGDVRTEQHLAAIDRAVETVRAAYRAGLDHRLFLSLMELESRCQEAEAHLNDLHTERHAARRAKEAL